MVSPAQKRAAVEALVKRGRALAVACRRVGLALSTWWYKPHKRPDEEDLVARIKELAVANPRFGYKRITTLLRREGKGINKKRVQRLWQREGLQVPKKSRKRPRWKKDHPWPDRGKHRNHVWTIDFLFDRTVDKKSIKVLSVLDEYTRECLALPCARSMNSDDVLRVLKRVAEDRGAPIYIRSDNGPEFIGKAMKDWEEDGGAKMRYCKPGSPWQNGVVESFHDKLRDEFLQMEIFVSVAEARVLLEGWRVQYNEFRPHSSLDDLTPAEFAALPCGADSATLHQPHKGHLTC